MKIKSILMNFIERAWTWVWAKADDEFKKMCVMTALHARWRQCSEDDVCELARFNERFELVRNPDALRLPTLLGSRMWHAVSEEVRSEHPTEHFFRRIALLTPCWLKYTDTKSYIEDLRQLYAYCMQERGQTA